MAKSVVTNLNVQGKSRNPSDPKTAEAFACRLERCRRVLEVTYERFEVDAEDDEMIVADAAFQQCITEMKRLEREVPGDDR
jgi:hypothetical protein